MTLTLNVSLITLFFLWVSMFIAMKVFEDSDYFERNVAMVVCIVATIGIIAIGAAAKYDFNQKVKEKQMMQNAYEEYYYSDELEFIVLEEMTLNKEQLSINKPQKTYEITDEMYVETGTYDRIEELEFSSVDNTENDDTIVFQICESKNPEKWKNYEPLKKIVIIK